MISDGAIMLMVNIYNENSGDTGDQKKGQQLSDEDIRENKSWESEAKMHRTKRAKALNNYQFVSIFCMKQHFMGNFFFFSSPFLGFLSLSFHSFHFKSFIFGI